MRGGGGSVHSPRQRQRERGGWGRKCAFTETKRERRGRKCTFTETKRERGVGWGRKCTFTETKREREGWGGVGEEVYIHRDKERKRGVGWGRKCTFTETKRERERGGVGWGGGGSVHSAYPTGGTWRAATCSKGSCFTRRRRVHGSLNTISARRCTPID